MTYRQFTAEATIATVTSFLFGARTPAITCLMIFFIINICLGLIKGIIEQELSSKKFIHGVFKGICISFMLIVGNQIDLVYPNGLGGLTNFRDLFLYFYIVYLLISILESYVMIGMPLPIQIKKALEVIKKEK